MHIHQVTLLSLDLPALKEFYTKVIGLPVLEAGEEVLTFGVGTSRLTFLQADEGWHGLYHVAFTIPENKFVESKAWLSTRVSLIRDTKGDDEFHFGQWNADAIYFYDPAGNIMELIARHDMKNATDEPFGSEHILSINEIGLTTPDVDETFRHLQSYLNIDVHRGTRIADFIAAGDDNGLLIISQLGRVWYPETGLLTEPTAVSAVVSDGTGQKFQISGPPYDITPVSA